MSNKITPELLQERWNAITYKDGGFLQLDTKHHLEWHVGYMSNGENIRKTLLLISKLPIGSVESSKSMEVTRRRKEDNRWTLAFELISDEQQSVFATFCCDVIEYSRYAKDEANALLYVINRYKHWSRLLKSQSKGLMDESKRKGLLGELLFLETKLATPLHGCLEIVQGWAGADSADQDFMYVDSWHEIKTVAISASKVTISSLEQLDRTDYGELVVMRIDCADREDSISLNEVVNRIKEVLAVDIDALELFESKLTAYGYIDLREYSEQKYYHAATQKYQVNSTFPRITSSSVSVAITSAQYEISLPTLEEWRIII